METHNDIVEKLLSEYEEDIIFPRNKDDGHAEVFDKHPITAMSEMEPNNTDRVLIITDSWKPEWCREGVQVPVKTVEQQKRPEIKYLSYRTVGKNFVLPDKLIRCTQKYEFDSSRHCRMPDVEEYLYEIDPIDVSWIEVSNIERQCLGLEEINESMIEVIFEVLERLCYKRIQSKVREAETEFLEHDENSKCDVCQSPEGEDGNELVFCEDCFVCVHQACYGIPELPSGSWICRHCDKCPNESSRCVLCPNRGGAMKQIDSEEEKWAHLSCAVWIPEVGFGNIDLMEPITRISSIPQARWNLRCHLCKTSNMGAPIQCSERKCKMAFHVTCAIKNNLIMKQEFQLNMDVKLLAYCKPHSKKYIEPNALEATADMGPRDIKELRIQKQEEFEKKFHEFVKIKDLSDPLIEISKNLLCSLKQIPIDIQEKVYTYWILKRTSNHFQCLIKPPRTWSEENQKQRVNNRSVFNAFCKIRFGLDRARLVVDMMVRREKKKAALFDVMSRISMLQFQQLKNSFRNPILKDDPSLAGNWGLISTVHLDNNVYVNPDNLIDANIEFAINKLNLKKPSIELTPKLMDFHNVFEEKRKYRRRVDGSASLRKFIKKPFHSVSAFNDSTLEITSALGSTTTKTEASLSKTSQMVLNSGCDGGVSCVSKIPNEQLIVPDHIKRNIYVKLKEPVFECYYLTPLITTDNLLESFTNELNRTKKEDSNEVCNLMTELPEESDSSNNSVFDTLSVFKDENKIDEKVVHSAPKRICVKICNEFDDQTICQKNQTTRNIFDDFITDQL